MTLHAATRHLGDGDYEVTLRATGETIGRVRRTTPAHASFTARWEALDTAGVRVASGRHSRADAVAALLDPACQLCGQECPACCPAGNGDINDCTCACA